MRLIILLLLTGCASLGHGGGRLGRRLVTGKQAPSTLFSGSASCTVDGGKFEQVKLNEYVWCAWEGTDKYPGPATVATGSGTTDAQPGDSRTAAEEAPPRAKPTSPPARVKPPR